MSFGTIEQAIADIRAGKFVIVADDEDRENEGDVVCAAQLVTPELVNFMIKRAGGMICLALTPERVAQLGLAQMSEAQLVAHRLKTERLVHRVAEARLPTEHGEWRIVGYRNDVDSHEHVALVFGEVGDGEDVLVRIHSKCLTGDVFHSLR